MMTSWCARLTPSCRPPLQTEAMKEDLKTARARAQELAKQAQQAKEALRVASVKAEGLETAQEQLQAEHELLQGRLERFTSEQASQKVRPGCCCCPAVSLADSHPCTMSLALAIAVGLRDLRSRRSTQQSRTLP